MEIFREFANNVFFRYGDGRASLFQTFYFNMADMLLQFVVRTKRYSFQLDFAGFVFGRGNDAFFAGQRRGEVSDALEMNFSSFGQFFTHAV